MIFGYEEEHDFHGQVDEGVLMNIIERACDNVADDTQLLGNCARSFIRRCREVVEKNGSIV